jgi:polysaccharide biosynthesis/export protein
MKKRFSLSSLGLSITNLIIFLFAFTCAGTAFAQTTNQSVAAQVNSAARVASSGQSVSAEAEAGRYRIGPGDVIDVKVFNKPQFSREGVKVDQRGMIRMPLVKEDIRAACRTEDELAAEVTTQLKEFVRTPEVIVQIKEYLSEPVAVQGAVRAPARFQLQRRIRLYELLTFANGPTETAGQTIQVVHTGPLATCMDSTTAPNSLNESPSNQIDYYKLSDTLKAEDKANPWIRPGDVISIPTADQVYVIGNVIRPTVIPLTEIMTVSRAIAMAGGAALDTKKSEIHIVRQVSGSVEKRDIIVDLDAINHHKAEDTVLMANDIVDVPASGSKRLFRSLMGAVVPSVGQLPVRVIP